VADITWQIEADFDRSGSYETDLTTYVSRPGNGITISRGVTPEGTPRVSTMSLSLNNSTGIFTPEYTSSSLYGLVKPGVPIRVTGTHNAIAYTLWTGYIQNFDSDWPPSGIPMTEAYCEDIAQWLQNYEGLNVLVSTSRDTDGALVAIFDAIGLTSDDRNFDDGIQALPYHFTRNQRAMDSVMDVVRSEMGGHVWVQADGKLRFESRQSRLGLNVDGTWGDSTSIVPRSARYIIDYFDYVSQISTLPTIFSTGQANDEIFRFTRGRYTKPTADSLAIAGGATYEAQWDYDSPITALTTPVAVADYTANTAANGSGTDRTSSLTVTVTDLGAGALIKLKNTHASTIYVTTFRLRGQSANFAGQTPKFTALKTITGQKMGRQLDLRVPFADDSQATRDYAVATLRTFRYVYPRLELQFECSSDAHKVAMLSLELGDLIYYKNTALTTSNCFVDDWWYVEALDISIPPNFAGKSFYAKVVLVPSYLYRNLDVIAYDNFTRGNATGDLGTSSSNDVWANDGNMNITSNTARANSDTLQMPNVPLTGNSGIAFGSVSTGKATSGSSLTFSHTVASASNRVLLVSLHYRGAGGWLATGVTYGGVALTRKRRDLAGDRNTDIWYLVAPTVGTADVVVTWSGDVGHQVAHAVSATNVNQTNPFGSDTGATGTSADATVNVTSENQHRVFAAGAIYPNGGVNSPATPGTGTTELVESFSSGSAATSEIISFTGHEAGATSVTINWTFPDSAFTWSISAVSLQPVTDDQVVEVSMSAIGTGDEVGLVFRYTDANNQYRVYLDKGSNELILEKNVASSMTEISSPAFTVGTAHELKALVQGTRIRVWVDLILRIDTTDAALSRGGNVGLFARNASATTTFDDMYAQVC